MLLKSAVNTKVNLFRGQFHGLKYLFNQQDGQFTWPAGVGNMFLIPIIFCFVVIIASRSGCKQIIGGMNHGGSYCK